MNVNTPESLAHFSQFLFACLGIFLIYTLLYRRYIVDRFRQDMFCLRDELFDQVALIPSAFTDPGYKRLRDTYNGFIRFAEAIGPIYLTVNWTVMTLTRNTRNSQEISAVSSSPELQAILSRSAELMGRRLVRYVCWDHLLTGVAFSTVFWTVRSMGWAFNWVGHRTSRFTPAFRTRPFRSALSAAFIGGQGTSITFQG